MEFESLPARSESFNALELAKVYGSKHWFWQVNLHGFARACVQRSGVAFSLSAKWSLEVYLHVQRASMHWNLLKFTVQSIGERAFTFWQVDLHGFARACVQRYGVAFSLGAKWSLKVYLHVQRASMHWNLLKFTVQSIGERAFTFWQVNLHGFVRACV